MILIIIFITKILTFTVLCNVHWNAWFIRQFGGPVLSTRGHTYRPLWSFLDVRTPSHAAGCSGGLASSLVDDRYVYSGRFLWTRNNAGPCMGCLACNAVTVEDKSVTAVAKDLTVIIRAAISRASAAILATVGPSCGML